MMALALLLLVILQLIWTNYHGWQIDLHQFVYFDLLYYPKLVHLCCYL